MSNIASFRHITLRPNSIFIPKTYKIEGANLHNIRALIYNLLVFNLPADVKMPEYPDSPFRFPFQ